MTDQLNLTIELTAEGFIFNKSPDHGKSLRAAGSKGFTIGGTLLEYEALRGGLNGASVIPSVCET